MPEETGPVLKYEYTIGGKKVWLRERIPVADGLKLMAAVRAVNDQEETLERDFPIFQALIERWEFDGNPATLAPYESMDYFSEYLPLTRAIGEHVGARVAGISKN